METLENRWLLTALLVPAESFETDGDSGLRYLSNDHSDGGGDYFERHQFDGAGGTNPHPGQLQMINSVDGNFAWAGEDVDADSPPAGPNGYVRLNDLTVTGFNNLRVTVALAFSDNSSEFEASDFIRVQAGFDGNSGGTAGSPGTALLAGTYTTVGQFIGTGVTSDGLGLDADLSGTLDGTETTRLTNTLTDYTFTISGTNGLPSTGTNLSLQIVAIVNGGNEEFVFDNIRVEGDVVTTDPPVLANIEVADIVYTEADPATQVTNTITVADTDSATLASGTVTITGGVPTEDALSATGAGSIVVTGGGTNTLTLTGAGTLAEYQTTLRSVTYTNTNTTNPSTLTRTVSFVLNDGTDNSNAETRDIQVAATIGTGTIPHTEDFETDGEGVRYLSNTHTDGSGDFFERHDFGTTNPHPGQAEAIVGVQGSFAWAGEDVDTSDNPLGSGQPGIVRIQDLDATGLTNLRVTVSLGVSQLAAGTEWETTDFIRVQAAFDGNSGGAAGGPNPTLTQGIYTTVGQFVGDGVTGNGPVADVDLDGLADVGGTQLDETMADFTFTISGTNGLPSTGSTLSVQIVAIVNGGNEEFVFDDIRVEGDVATTDPPVLANIEVADIIYTEADPATQVTNTITVADTDSATLASGTVTITGGVPTEDALSATGAGSIVVTGGGTNTLTLTGAGTLAEYQTTLRSVTYTNTNTTNPSTLTRTVSFVLNDGTDNSNAETRDIQVAATIGTGTIPHTEDFETDGEGVRYLSNTHTDGSGDFFERHDFGTTNPHPGQAEAIVGVQGSFAWAGEDVDTSDNPLGSGQPGIVRIQDLDATGLTNLRVTVSLGVSQLAAGTEWETTDFIRVQAAFDGNSGGAAGGPNPTLTQGIYTTVGQFVGDGVTGNGPVADVDLDGLADVGGTQLDETMADFTFTISGTNGLPSTGSTLSVQIVAIVNGGNEEFVFDDIRIEGDVVATDDFGDAPDPTYPTLLASNGARHTAGGPLFLGAGVDAEPDGQPSGLAIGDDTDSVFTTPGDIGFPPGDEDGVLFTSTPPLVTGLQSNVTVTASAVGLLNAWVDFDGNGSWADAGEQVFTNVALIAGPNPLSFTIPATATPTNLTFARFRVDSGGGLSFTGPAADGEVEDYALEINGLDFGDAPDPSYPTLTASNGARHILSTGPNLGAAVDAEPDGQPNATATGDDLAGVTPNDEDGVAFTGLPLVAGTTEPVDVTATAGGLLNAWLDFNDNGSWADPGEQIFTNQPLVAGLNSLSFTVPASATATAQTFARFRFDQGGGLSFYGLAPDGDVED